MDEPIDPFVAHHDGRLRVHAALVAGVRALVQPVTLDLLVPQALGVCRFLLGHHIAEDEVLFPSLRRSSRLRSTDVVFLDACDLQHRELHSLCDHLREAASGPHPQVTVIRSIATELEAALTRHVCEEEAGLVPECLREMIDRAGLDALGREIEAVRRRFAPDSP